MPPQKNGGYKIDDSKLPVFTSKQDFDKYIESLKKAYDETKSPPLALTLTHGAGFTRA